MRPKTANNQGCKRYRQRCPENSGSEPLSQSPVAKAFIKNMGFKQGAIASTVAHDSHNIVAVGVDDESLCRAVNLVIEQKGWYQLCKTTTVKWCWLCP